mmetsp:Transcript_6918/g.12783  ORF Transcript_6918/g.12783 Transcript_6918/m.12783 type:complete len:333 (-) Transcript_6918:1400-2398(-)|eukprot:CAMPEP_0184551632 /NCGR_PEP_ID=MMETSP0199_2-20130426/25968_1 /TAXON_ID=1112570 /ORGANISM="Thraustochytrium sp., Strain LLF1b" /LENGTH=332 /DNA_ID=CAMNT_0026946889 /DNA_START=260 /DNA_END=1258 /DNA_ORIENTATION=+
MEIASRVGESVDAKSYKAAKRLEDVIAKPSKRRWRVFKIFGSQPRVHRDPAQFQACLSEAFGVYFDHTVQVLLHQRSLWVKVALHTQARTYKDHVFLVHPPHSCYLFITPIRGKETPPIFMQAICTAFQCPNIKELQLYGNDIQTLKDLALQKLSQGAFQSYRSCTSVFDTNPLENEAQITKRRRAVIEKILSESREEEKANELVGKDRNKVVQSSQRRQPEERFTSTRNRQNDDTSNKLSQICLASTGDVSRPDGSTQIENFGCFIRLEGDDVMHGLESLYENDLVVAGKEIPRALDVNNLLARHLSGRGPKRAKLEDEEASNDVLWMKTV